MARKVFISFLGTNNYLQTHYEIAGEKSAPVRFIQEALVDCICKDWSENDKILVFYTEESKRRNWEDNGQEQAETEIDKMGLKTILSKKKFSGIVEGVMIKEGFSEEEIWSIFDVVYNKIEQDDEIYFDVTHAFRSIPMFSTVLFNFAHLMKNATLKSVHYGAFEKLGPAYEVKKKDLAERVAPVIDLTSLVEVQNLTQIASGMVDYGKIGKIGSMFDVSTLSKNSLKQAVQKLKQEIENLESYIITNSVAKIIEGKFVDNINVQIKQLKKSQTLNHPELEILERLLERISVFSVGSEKNVQAAIEWAYEFDMLPQAYTLAQEYVISQVVKIYEESNFYSEEGKKDSEIKFRTFISAVLGIRDEKVRESLFEEPLTFNLDLAKGLLAEERIINIRKGYIRLANNRNNLNHAKKSDNKIEQFKREFKSDYSICLNALGIC